MGLGIPLKASVGALSLAGIRFYGTYVRGTPGPFIAELINTSSSPKSAGCVAVCLVVSVVGLPLRRPPRNCVQTAHTRRSATIPIARGGDCIDVSRSKAKQAVDSRPCGQQARLWMEHVDQEGRLCHARHGIGPQRCTYWGHHALSGTWLYLYQATDCPLTVTLNSKKGNLRCF